MDLNINLEDNGHSAEIVTSVETMLEKNKCESLDKTAWQWRAHQLTRNKLGRVTYPNCREVGFDFNVGSSKKQNLDLSILTNGVMLDISDFAKDVHRAQVHFIFSILENNFDLGLENDPQRYDFATRVLMRVKELMKKKKDTPAFLDALFDLPDMNTMALSPYARRLNQNDSLIDTSRPQHVEIEPDSPTRMEGTLSTSEETETSRPQHVEMEPDSPTRMEGTLSTSEETETSRPQHVEIEPDSPTRMEGTLSTSEETETSRPQHVEMEPDSPTRMEGTLSISDETETSRPPPHVEMEPDSPTRMEGTLSTSEETVYIPVGQSLTEPSTTKMMRDLYPLCWEIGLELGLKSKYWPGQKLDRSLLTKGVMIEVANFTKYLCGAPKQIMFDLLKHNFDIDIENPELSESLQNRLSSARTKRKLSSIGSSWKKPLFIEFLNETFSLSPMKKKASEDREVTNAPVLECPRIKKVTEMRRLDLKRKQEELAELKKREEEEQATLKKREEEEQATLKTKVVDCQGRHKRSQYQKYTTSDCDALSANAAMFKQGNSLSFLCPIEESMEDFVNEPETCSENYHKINMNTATNTFVENDVKQEENKRNSADIWRDTTSQSTLLSDIHLSRNASLIGETMLEKNNGEILHNTAWQWRAHQSMSRNRLGTVRYPNCIEVGLDFNVGSSKKEKLDLSFLTNGVMIEISDFSKDVRKTQEHIISSILENNFHFGLANEQWYDYARCVMRRVKELMKKKKDTPEFLAALFDLPDPNTVTISEYARTLNQNDSFPETSRPQHVKTEPASPTRTDETLTSDETVHRPVEGQSLTAPSTKEMMSLRDLYQMMRELYPLCWEIGLELAPKSKQLSRQKLDPMLLTNGVMIEVVNFTKYVCGEVPRQMIFDLLKHNFDLDIENLGLSDIFTSRLCEAKNKRKYFPPQDRPLFVEFQKKAFSLIPRKKREVTNAPVSTCPRLKQVTETRRLKLKRKQEEEAKLEKMKQEEYANIKKRRQEEYAKMKKSKEEEQAKLKADVYFADWFNEPATFSDNDEEIYMNTATNNEFVAIETHKDELPFSIEPWSHNPPVEIQRSRAEIFVQESGPTDIFIRKPDLHSWETENQSDSITIHMCKKMIQHILGDDVGQRGVISRLASMFRNGMASENNFEQILIKYRSEILPLMVKEYGGLSEYEKTKVTLTNKLFCGLYLIDGLTHQARTTLLLWDKIVVGEKEIGTCNLEEEKNDSGTMHLIRTASDAVQRRGFTKDGELVTFKNFLIDKGEFDDVPLKSPSCCSIDRFFHDGAGVYSILDDMREFARDHVDDSGLAAVVADLEIPHIKAGIRALGLISKLVIDPLLKAITSNGNMIGMEDRYQTLVSKLKEWQGDGRDLVEGSACLYDDIQVPKDIVFDRLTMPTDYEFFELTLQIVESLLASLWVVCYRMQSGELEQGTQMDAEKETKMDARLSKDLGGVERLHKAKVNAVSIALESVVTYKSKRT